jgi:hypothetical protein
MIFIHEYSKELTSLLVPLVGAIVAALFRARAKLIWSVHSWKNLLTEEFVAVEVGPPAKKLVNVHTATLFFQNLGREAATEIEIVFNWKPPIFQIWPTRQYITATNPDGRFIIKFPNLAPKESLGIDLLSVRNELPALIQCRSLQGNAKKIETTPQQVHPAWKLWMVAFLMFMGLVSSIYLIISIIQFFAHTA